MIGKSSKLTVIAIIGMFTFACKSTETASTQTVSTQPSEERSSSASTEELEELYWARIDSSRMNFTQADVDFMTNMIGHHAQALIMSDLAPENDASPVIQTLAARIINAQKDEIATMQTWLRDREQLVPEVHIDGLMLMIHGVGNHHDHMNMQGMLTQDQLVELSEAKGKEFDRLFLTYMIQHHQGAVTMVKKLIATDGAVQDEAAFRLATDINVDQITEIERMRSMLSDLELNGEL